MSRLAVGSDHAGFRAKEKIRRLLEERGLSVRDFGTDGEASVDYPDIGFALAEAVSRGEVDRGILVCGSGVGMSVVANRVPGVRAALVTDPAAAAQSRAHVDANVLVLPGRPEPPSLEEIVTAWLETPFEGGRHAARLKKIEERRR